MAKEELEKVRAEALAKVQEIKKQLEEADEDHFENALTSVDALIEDLEPANDDEEEEDGEE